MTYKFVGEVGVLSWVVTSHGGEQFFLEMPHLLYYEFAKRSFFKHQGFLAEVERIFKKTSMLKAPDQESVLYENRLAMNDVLVYGALSLEA